MGKDGRISALSSGHCRLLREVARRCLLSCLRILDRVRLSRSGGPYVRAVFGTPPKKIKTCLHCSYEKMSWQAAELLRWLERLAARKRSWSAALAGRGRHAGCRERKGFEVAALLALVVIPVAGFTGSWDLAANEAAEFFRRLAALVDDRGRPCPTYLKQLTVPVLWSLVFTRLAEPRKAARRRARADELRRTRVVAEVFAALSRLGDVPASVCFAAATLAAVTDSPAAPVWMTRANQLARRHGAKGFASLFGQLARRRRPEQP